MSSFLDIREKIANLEALLESYQEGLYEAEGTGDIEKTKYYTKCIAETEHKISGLKNSPYYNWKCQ